MKMKRLFVVMVSILMAAALAGCGSGTGTETEDADVYRVEDTVLDEKNESEDTNEGKREETVTVKANADGTFRSATISRGGDMDEDADISGIPFSVKVTYTLDGKEVSAEDLAGASGRLKIRFDYENNSKRTVSVNGEDKETIVPFAFLTVMMLPNDRFSNIEVTNGGVRGMGDDRIVYGYAIPGLEKELNTEEIREELKEIGRKLDEEGEDNTDENGGNDEPLFPEYIEISADTRNCKIEFNVTMVTNGLFRDADDGDIDEFEDSVKGLWDFGAIGGELAEGVGELYDGAMEFGDGLETYADGAGSLAQGADQLSSGAAALDSQSQALRDGASQLASSVAALKEQMAAVSAAVPGMEELVGYMEQISNGAAVLKDGVNAYTDGVSQIAEGSAYLSSGAWQLSEAGGELTDGYSKLTDGIWELKDAVEEIKNKVFWNVSSLSVGAIPGSIDNFRALKQADCEYMSFDGREGSEGMNFIIEIADIG